MDLGATIKNIRKQKGFNQKTFAEKCNITPSYLSQIENNTKEPKLATLRVISDKLGVPLPIIFFLSLDDADIKPEKKSAFSHIAPSVKSMIESFFTNDSNHK